MTAWRAFLVLTLALLVAGRGLTAEPAVGTELVYLGQTQLLRVRVRVDLEGQPLEARWRDALQRLFCYLDRNDDGFLDRDEASRAPTPLRSRQLGWGYFFAAPPTSNEWLLPPGNSATTRLSFNQMLAQYERHGCGPLHVAVAVSPTSALLTRGLLRHLDTNRDGTIDAAEGQFLEKALSTLDHNADELIAPAELVDGMVYPGIRTNRLLTSLTAATSVSPKDTTSNFLLLPASEQNDAWTRTVLQRRDRNGDHHLDHAEAGLTGAVFKPLDANGDGLLDHTELLAWHRLPPDRELHIQLGQGTDAVLDWQAFPAGPRQKIAGEFLQVPLEKTRVTIAAAATSLSADYEAAQRTARQRFQEADSNKDGVLDPTEAKQSTFPALTLHFPLADRNSDNKLSLTEWNAWLDLQGHFVRGQVTLTILDQGAGLFEVLDADRDGQLSIQELRGGWSRLKESGCVVQDRVDLQRLPQQLFWAVSQGQVRWPIALTRHSGPDWFRAMDRNGDGVVSRSEFSGPPEAFTRLDRNGDGLLTADEADAAKGK